MELFDSHFHIIESEFPILSNNGFIPDYYTVEEYKKELAEMNIEVVGGVVVSGSFQGFDQSYLKNALTKLGSNFVGITQINEKVSDEEIQVLTEIGVRGIRFNLYRGLTENLEMIEKLANRVYEIANWKTEIYLNLDTMDQNLENIIYKLPKVSIDHLGMGAHSKEKLKKLLAFGIPVRVTGFGRIEYLKDDLSTTLPELFSENPDGLIFGSDLPSTRARERFKLEDILLIKKLFSSSDAEKILVKNGQNWYLNN